MLFYPPGVETHDEGDGDGYRRDREGQEFGVSTEEQLQISYFKFCF